MWDGRYLKFYDCGFVVIEIAVIRSGEEGNDCWKFLRSGPFIHLESLGLSLMRPDYRNYLVFLEKVLG